MMRLQHLFRKAHRLFRKCICHVEIEDEFEETWQELLNSPDCNEASNGPLHLDFVISFGEMVNRWRNNESDEDFQCKNEYLEGVFCSTIKEELQSGSNIRYRILLKGKKERDRFVDLNVETMDVTCSSMHFESVGILCAHILKVFHHKGINHIPSKYVIERWTIHAKKRLNKVRHNSFEVGKENSVETNAAIVFVSRMRRAYDLVMRANDHAFTKDMLNNAFEVHSKKIDEYLCSADLNMHLSVGNMKVVELRVRLKMTMFMCLILFILNQK
ncbi:hypothetical protein M9H77_10777 [Catharanthus roseus]|uniref:Uncharacterized protein n=1 Tax=Catharanthus roseus TaxID=4058 RepID=A0ACC0BCP6_CATRO|nr:hypothetical protein M9H77_10777 [Catharanthus roseus]